MVANDMTVGIVGLGLIGGSLARRLASRGVRTIAWNHRDRPYAQAERDGIRCVASLRALAQERPDAIVLCNPLVAMPSVLHVLAARGDTAGPAADGTGDGWAESETIRKELLW